MSEPPTVRHLGPTDLRLIAEIAGVDVASKRIEAVAHKNKGAEYLVNQFVGQVVGQMNDVQSCRSVIEEMVQEYVDTLDRLNEWADA